MAREGSNPRLEGSKGAPGVLGFEPQALDVLIAGYLAIALAVELAARRTLRPDRVVEAVDLAIAGEVLLAVLLGPATAPDAILEVVGVLGP